MKTSEQINELAAALCAAQAVMKAAPMSGKNPHLNNRYATLGDIIDTARKPLADNGLSYVQFPVSPEQLDTPFVGLTTRLMHKSGQWLESTVFFPVDGGSNRAVSMAQVAGGRLTYMRRYALAAALGIVADEDADGNEPAAKESRPAAKPKPAAPGQQYVDGSTVGAKESVYYQQHIDATGRAPENVTALREWYKAQRANGNGAPKPAGRPLQDDLFGEDIPVPGPVGGGAYQED